jgi:hypothetical protein
LLGPFQASYSRTHFLPFSAQDFGEENTKGFLQP